MAAFTMAQNMANAIVSYYQKGALAALVLDLYLRRETDGEFSLDRLATRHRGNRQYRAGGLGRHR